MERCWIQAKRDEARTSGGSGSGASCACSFADPGDGVLAQLRPGEALPSPALHFVAEQIGAAPEAIAACGTRAQTRYEHFDALREAFGFADVTPARQRELGAWLLPVAPATTSAAAVASALLDETRRRRLIVPTPAGRASASWRLGRVPGGEDALRLRWAEAGGPAVAGPPGRRGFGTRVPDATVRGQLEGALSLDWRATGLVCEMEVPPRRVPGTAALRASADAAA
jgi:uncharacterized protein DUF4158